MQEFKQRFDETEEQENEELDAMIYQMTGHTVEELREMSRPQEGAITMYDPMRLECLRFCARAARRALRRTPGVQVVSGQNELEPHLGAVRLEGWALDFGDTEWMARAAEFADSMEVYPLADGRLRATFTFHGVMRTVGTIHG